MEKLIMLPIIIVCLMRTTSYGIYTMRENNKYGAVGLFALAAAAAVASVFFMMK